ncbi:dTTP/UTP pyrophosphatase-like isoform X3 [Montipora capricornis]|uniref:dTTP/UTP pyrophosphatase-like isoform X3 n=1 Tax=Montipora capricornis TaxID=246305 RepID=UPI0035F16C45
MFWKIPSKRPWKWQEELIESRYTPAELIVCGTSLLGAPEEKKEHLIIGADTVVVLNDKILEKPKDKDNAFEMLQSLSGKNHKVFSGVTLVQGDLSKAGEDSNIVQFYEETLVSFGHLTDDVIHGYIKTGEPMDKAGSYGIQGIGGTLVKSIQGDYFNVMGFPLYHFCLQIRKLFESKTSLYK